jgi:hypothetical protein
VIGMSFTLPWPKPKKNSRRLVRRRLSWVPIPCPVRLIGVLFINYFWTILGLIALFQQDWFQCRQWTNSDVSNLNIIGDNYEAQTVLIITANQYMSTAGLQLWLRVSSSALLPFLQWFRFSSFWSHPSYVACLWRVNCENENVLYSIVHLHLCLAYTVAMVKCGRRWASLFTSSK